MQNLKHIELEMMQQWFDNRDYSNLNHIVDEDLFNLLEPMEIN